MRNSRLEKRQSSEQSFFDEAFGGEKQQGNLYNLGFKSAITARFIEQLGSLEGKKVMELGCGRGWFTKILAERGGDIWACDISREAIKETISMAERLNLESRIHADQMAAEKLAYDSETFDVVVGNAILHHLELEPALREIQRVLKHGGKAYFMEPLGHNALLNFYRRKTPRLRTADEVPMRFEDFRRIKEYFSSFEHEEYYLTALLALTWYLIGTHRPMLATRNLLLAFDKVALRLFPFLRRYCWYSILTMVK